MLCCVIVCTEIVMRSNVSINGASSPGNSGKTGNACSADVEMSDMRDCVANDSYF